MAYESKCGKATGYAVISIRTAWLSYHYPLEFMTALLNSNISKKEKLEHYVSKIKALGFNMMGPDVNESQELFSISYKDEGIRFGLRGIKGLGKSSLTVIGAREDKPFKSLTDFVERVNVYFKCDKKILENIAMCGGFESIEPNRRAIVESSDVIVDSLRKNKSKNVAGQMNMFDMFKENEDLMEVRNLKLADVKDYSQKEKLDFEKELLSFYVSGHPLDVYDNIINEAKQNHLSFISDIKMELGEGDDELLQNGNFSEGKTIEEVTILAQIIEVKNMMTKSGETMSRLVIEDKSGSMDCVVFPKTRTAYRNKIVESSVVAITGKAVKDDFGTQILVSDIADPQILSSSGVPNKIIVRCPYSRTGPERPLAVKDFTDLRDLVDKSNRDARNAKNVSEILFIVEGQMFHLGKIPYHPETLINIKSRYGENKVSFE